MGLFEDIFIKAKDAANNVGEKAGKFVDISKLNIEITEMKAKLKGKFENLGKIVYQNGKDGICNKEILIEEIRKIDKLYAEIETIRKELAILKKKIICKACGQENFSDAFYCSKCGHTLEIKCTCKSDVDCCKQENACECNSQGDGCDCSSGCECDELESSSDCSDHSDYSSESED